MQKFLASYDKSVQQWHCKTTHTAQIHEKCHPLQSKLKQRVIFVTYHIFAISTPEGNRPPLQQNMAFMSKTPTETDCSLLIFKTLTTTKLNT